MNVRYTICNLEIAHKLSNYQRLCDKRESCLSSIINVILIPLFAPPVKREMEKKEENMRTFKKKIFNKKRAKTFQFQRKCCQ